MSLNIESQRILPVDLSREIVENNLSSKLPVKEVYTTLIQECLKNDRPLFEPHLNKMVSLKGRAETLKVMSERLVEAKHNESRDKLIAKVIRTAAVVVGVVVALGIIAGIIAPCPLLVVALPMLMALSFVFGTGVGVVFENLFNGKISEIAQKDLNNPNQRAGVDYLFNRVNRLETAIAAEKASLTVNVEQLNAFFKSEDSYNQVATWIGQKISEYDEALESLNTSSSVIDKVVLENKQKIEQARSEFTNMHLALEQYRALFLNPQNNG